VKLRFLSGLILGALPVLAQLSAPNAAGASAGKRDLEGVNRGEP